MQWDCNDAAEPPECWWYKDSDVKSRQVVFNDFASSLTLTLSAIHKRRHGDKETQQKYADEIV